MFTYVLIAVAAYGGLIAILFIIQRNLLYHPSPGNMDPAVYGVPEMERVQIQAKDGLQLVAWYRPGEAGKQTILFLHGNAGHIGHRSGKVRLYLDKGYGVLLLSYRGFGSNAGSPTEVNLYIDGRAALKFLTEQHVPLKKLAIYGESLGTGVAVELARHLSINCLILEAPFTSVPDLAAHHYFFLPVSLLVKDRFASIKKINDVISPKFFIHGEHDRVIPWTFGNQLYQAASEPKELLLISDAGHNNLYDFGVGQKVIKFLEKHH